MVKKSEGETGEQLLRRCIENFERRKVQTVRDSSHIQYSTGSRAFASYMEAVGLDYSMKSVPATFGDMSMGEYQTVIMGSFMSFLSEDKGNHHTTVKGYVCGVKDFCKREGIDISEMDTVSLKGMQRAIGIEWSRTHEGLADGATLPFTLEMIYKWRSLTNVKRVEELAMLLAAELQHSQLLRVGEMLPCSIYHFLRTQDVQFEMRYASGGSFFVSAMEAFKYDIGNLVSVHILVRSAKNDPEGKGYKYSHPNVSRSPSRVINLAETMFLFASLASPLVDDPPFISYVKGSTRWFLDYAKYNKKIKEVAQLCGLDPAQFSTHSMRIAGATLMFAAGYEDSYIKNMGRWKSDIFRKYIHFQSVSKMSIQKSLCDPTILTTDDVRRSCPSASGFSR